MTQDFSAEAQGFEPRVPSQVRLFSRQVHSTALASLHFKLNISELYSDINSSLSK